jgi:hypothetical protein
MEKDIQTMKKWLITLCDFFKYQLENDRCTAEEIRSFSNMVNGNLEVDATVEDMAGYFGQSEQNVRNVLNRHYGDRPKRRTLHSMWFAIRNAPAKWFDRK